ncbi:MAG: hypothetical protein U0821_27925 [Chloroflexota bacterium]
MSYTIRWVNPLSAGERRWLRNWVEKVNENHPDVVERRRGGLLVRDDQPERVHSFAALTMAVLGRDPMGYELVPTAEAGAAGLAA